MTFQVQPFDVASKTTACILLLFLLLSSFSVFFKRLQTNLRGVHISIYHRYDTNPQYQADICRTSLFVPTVTRREKSMTAL